MNRIGRLFSVTTWGESHGPAVGALIEGCPAGLVINEEVISEYLQQNDRPIPEIATGRIEKNSVKFLAGYYSTITIGTPLMLSIKNCDARSSEYDDFQNIFRPGHADFSWYAKYGRYNPPGGGRASGRVMIALLAAGFIARQIIEHYFPEILVSWKIVSMAGVTTIDPEGLKNAVKSVLMLAETGESSGGEVEFVINGMPAGLGEPRSGGFNVQLGAALLSIGGIKSISIGGGKQSADKTGSRFNGGYGSAGNEACYISENGGICGGVTDGTDIRLGCTVKPVPTRMGLLSCLDQNGSITVVRGSGRHDLNFTPRIGPVGQALIYIVILDNLMVSGHIQKDRLV